MRCDGEASARAPGANRNVSSTKFRSLLHGMLLLLSAAPLSVTTSRKQSMLADLQPTYAPSDDHDRTLREHLQSIEHRLNAAAASARTSLPSDAMIEGAVSDACSAIAPVLARSGFAGLLA